jgi:ABC-type branched-subunit amino acid transport system ATPase component
VRFGGVFAVRDVSLVVRQGQIHGLIGPNGAGKTTVIDAITGFEETAAGTIRFDGQDVSRWAPHRRTRAGLSRTFQNLELFEDMTVAENLTAAVGHRGGLDLSENRAVQLLKISHLLDAKVGALAHGVRRLVSVARALMTNPTLLILDEPAAGLDDEETEALGSTLRQLQQADVTVLLVDHDMTLVLSVCDVITVLDRGVVLARGEPSEIKADPAVRLAYLGED